MLEDVGSGRLRNRMRLGNRSHARRTAPGKIVTNAKAGQSFHNFRCAVDVVPIVAGKPRWDVKDEVWQKIGALGKAQGLEWAGDWKRFREYPHFQYTGGLTLAQLQAGGKIA